jgi:hypothetical protein
MWFDSVQNPFDIAIAAKKSLSLTDSAIDPTIAIASD